MTLTADQQKFAYAEFHKDFKGVFGTMPFTKPEIKQAIDESEAWAELPATKSDVNSNLTTGPFKSNATADQKRFALIFALLAIIKA